MSEEDREAREVAEKLGMKLSEEELKLLGKVLAIMKKHGCKLCPES